MDNKKARGLNGAVFLVFVIFLFAALWFTNQFDQREKEITWKNFQQLVQNDKIESVEVNQNKSVPTGRVEITLKGDDDSDKIRYLYVSDVNEIQDYLKEQNVEYTMPDIPQDSWAATTFLPVILTLGGVFLLFGLMNRQGGGANSKAMNFGKSRARLSTDRDKKVTFAQVAGLEEEKEELEEIVDFLKSPKKYIQVGARIPKGVLLVGPPGTGKTLLAKAVAGEAGVPFFTISGSDFVEMFVGVGASRVRDLFEEAKKNAPCIIFIDEIDAVARRRGTGMGGGHDEREQTLNQLLVEMDGFGVNEGIIVMAATNRVDILDPAILRPGRFDRRIIVDKPDLKGRVEILKVHAKDVKMDETVDFDAIALATSGAVGSDLANMINEAAINAVKEGREYVCQKDLFEAVEQVLVGKEKKDRIMSAQERKIVSYHEVGHALIAALQKNSEPVQKITIVPRTMGALGYVMHVPEEEKYLNTEAEIHDMLVGYLGGRAAEEIVFDTVTTGASNDIEQATGLARSMVTRFGMSKKFGLIGLESVESQYLDGRTVLNCSDATAAEIDQEVMRILKECYQEALELLSANREVMDQLAAHLIEKETITGKEFMRIYRQVKGLPQEEPEQTAGAQMKAAEQTADTANPSQSDSGNSYDTASASGTDTAAQPQSSTPKPWEEFARQQQEREDSFFSGDAQQPGDTQQPADPSDAEQSQEQDKPWIPPTPKPENKGPVGRFSGASLPDDEKK